MMCVVFGSSGGPLTHQHGTLPDLHGAQPQLVSSETAVFSPNSKVEEKPRPRNSSEEREDTSCSRKSLCSSETWFQARLSFEPK